MEAISRSCTPHDAVKQPLLLVTLTPDEDRARVYRERADCFKGKLTTQQYVSKMQSLDGYATTKRCKSVWVFVAAGELHDIRSTMEIYVREIYYRPRPGKPVVIRYAAYVAALFTPLRHRGNGYAREILKRVMATIQARFVPPPLSEISVLFGSASPDMRAICT